MNREDRIIVLVKLLDENLESNEFNCHRSNYNMTSVERNICNLLNMAKKEFCDDLFFENLINFDSPENDCFIAAENAVSYMQQFLGTYRPEYLNDLLENANLMMEEKLFNCSAYCIRLYAETVMKVVFDEIIDFGKANTLGNKFEFLEDCYDADEYDFHFEKIRRLNKIIHNDDKVLSKEPVTTSEISNLIMWVKNFEQSLKSKARNYEKNS